MALYLVLLYTILAFSLTSTEQYVSSPGSNINLSLDSMKNASGHWITKVDTVKENPRLLSENVHQGTSNGTEQVVSVHDTSMSGVVQPTAAPTTNASSTTTTTPSTSTSTSTSPTNTSTTPTTTTPKSCPQLGYKLYTEFNCYKAFHLRDERKSWSEAREQCVRDGGDLMVMESDQERTDVYIPLFNSVSWYNWPWVGVYIPQAGTNWTTVKGEPVLSTLWRPGEPDGDSGRKCAVADYSGLLGTTIVQISSPSSARSRSEGLVSIHREEIAPSSHVSRSN